MPRSKHVGLLWVLALLGIGSGALGACNQHEQSRAPSAPIEGGNGRPRNTSASGGASSADGGLNYDAGRLVGDSGAPLAVDVSNVPPFSVGGDPAAALDTLTDSDITTLCNNTRAYFFANVSQTQIDVLACYFADGKSGRSKSDCETRVDQCLALTTPFDHRPVCALDGLKRGDTTSLDAAVPPCTANVAEYVDCVTEQVSVLSAQFMFDTCERANPDDSATAPQQLTGVTARCNAFFAACHVDG